MSDLKELREEIERLQNDKEDKCYYCQLEGIKQAAEAYSNYLDNISKQMPMGLLISHGWEGFKVKGVKELKKIKELLDIKWKN